MKKLISFVGILASFLPFISACESGHYEESGLVGFGFTGDMIVSLTVIALLLSIIFIVSKNMKGGKTR